MRAVHLSYSFVCLPTGNIMSLKVKSVQYDDVNLSTYHDVEIFTEELRVLIASGYSVNVEIIANTNLNQDFEPFKPQCSNLRKFDSDQGISLTSYQPQCSNVRKYDGDQTTSFTSYNINPPNIKNEPSSSNIC